MTNRGIYTEEDLLAAIEAEQWYDSDGESDSSLEEADGCQNLEEKEAECLERDDEKVNMVAS